MLVKKLENARGARGLPLILSHFNTEQSSALLKLIFMFYLVFNRNNFK